VYHFGVFGTPTPTSTSTFGVKFIYIFKGINLNTPILGVITSIYTLKKLTKAVSICLVTDIWSSVTVISFLGLAAMIINDKFEKEIITIGLTELSLPQNAENVKKAIESIINGYNFNKILTKNLLIFYLL